LINKAIDNRKKGYEDYQFVPLKSFKNIHLGKRCFIVATGPSLTMEDLVLINDEITFGMNSVCKIFDKTSWRPTYYGIQDCFVYRQLEKDILNYYKQSDNVFIADRIAKQFKTPGDFHKFPLNCAYHENEMELDHYFADFSDDSYAIVYDGYSITYSLIQIAVYMGFTEIYLIGVDCNYKKGEKNHFAESGFIDKNEEKNHDKMTTGYIVAKDYADSHNIKIVNCTRGGMLEVFERKNLEDVLVNKGI
jgi:hypothetical protein